VTRRLGCKTPKKRIDRAAEFLAPPFARPLGWPGQAAGFTGKGGRDVRVASIK
jgi:hypothetical protein